MTKQNTLTDLWLIGLSAAEMIDSVSIPGLVKLKMYTGTVNIGIHSFPTWGTALKLPPKKAELIAVIVVHGIKIDKFRAT